MRIIISILMSWSFTISAQEISWTKFKDLNDSLRVKIKPVMVFIHTDWCKYCKMQENTTFRDAEVVNYLNQNYYSLILNAESLDSIVFLNKMYPKSINAYHSLAKFLGEKDGKLSFPTTVLLDGHLLIEERFIGLARKMDILK